MSTLPKQPLLGHKTQREVLMTSVDEPLIRLSAVDKVYRTGKLEYPALRSVDLEIARGEMVGMHPAAVLSVPDACLGGYGAVERRR